jgi:hypothetical protein
MKALVAKDAKKAVTFGARIGFALAIICHLVPHEYRAVCELIAKICTGGI